LVQEGTERSGAPEAVQAGYGHLAANRLAEAAAVFEAMVRADAASPEAWRGLGLAHYKARRFEPAERAFRKALAIDPRRSGLKELLAAALRATGKPEPAIKLYEEAARERPDDAGMLNNWGNALVDAGRIEDAIGVLQRAVELVPSSGFYRVNLAKAFLKVKRTEEAIRVLEGIPPERRDPPHTAELGNALLALGRYDEAIASFRRAHSAGYKNAGMYHNLATALQYVGSMDEAETAYRWALETDPKFVVSHRQLSGIRRFEHSDQEIAELESAVRKPELSALDRSELYLSLAKAYDDTGDYDRAFANLQAANQLIRSTIEYSADENSDFVDRMIGVFTPGLLRERAHWGLGADRPVFILGMPRSGTTLTEQILCSHPNVFGAGELMTIYRIAVKIRTETSPDRGLAGSVENLTENTTRQYAQSYLDHLASLNEDARFVSDKLPFNFRYLGHIALFFPKAKIIHCTRNPLDIALSCYFARFNDQLSFSFNLSEIGRYYRDYERLMRHWVATIPNPILHVSYEELVRDQERVTKEMLGFCGLEWDERCLRFHETSRPVLTASSWQVRQPMYASSAGRWRNYEKHLRPLSTILGAGRVHDFSGSRRRKTERVDVAG
jgi:tetratricopeptide (TPR) repeat protein